MIKLCIIIVFFFVCIGLFTIFTQTEEFTQTSQYDPVIVSRSKDIYFFIRNYKKPIYRKPNKILNIFKKNANR
jgi:hypothetical protein